MGASAARTRWAEISNCEMTARSSRARSRTRPRLFNWQFAIRNLQLEILGSLHITQPLPKVFRQGGSVIQVG